MWWQQGKSAVPSGRSFSEKLTTWLLLVVVTLGIGSCTASLPETHIEVVIDHTDAQAPFSTSVDSMFDYVMSFVKRDYIQGHWGEITINLSTIGDVSFPKTKTLHLAKSASFLWRNELEEQARMQRFEQEVKTKLAQFMQPSPAKPYSYVHRNLCYRLHDLARRHGNTVVLLFSDLVQNDHQVNFYAYKNPKEILVHQDSLEAIFDTHYALPDLSDILLINVYTPRYELDALHETSKQFFKGYWQRHGMKVIFASDLPVGVTKEGV